MHRNISWSKLKKRVESRFTDSVKGRVCLYSTKYRGKHAICQLKDDGRAWITIDGEEIANMSNFASYPKLGIPEGILSESKRQELREEGIFSQEDLGESMFDYLNLSMEGILKSDNIVIKAIGMLDKRLGKRRLESLEKEKRHPLVQRLLDFRLETEGLKP